MKELEKLIKKIRTTENATPEMLMEGVSKYYERGLKRKKIYRQEDVVGYLKSITASEKTEGVYIFYLDVKNKIMEYEKVSEGTVECSLMYPREIVKRALDVGAYSVIMAHNHPSGESTPSEQDDKATRKVVFALSCLGIKMLDHVIVGGNTYYSYHEEGKIETYTAEYRRIRV